jgi:nucleoside triphosphate diphosphatase
VSSRLSELLSIMARLRAADGCPWDRQQSFASIAPFTIEEAYEVADAIERGSMGDLKDELGDLLFQVVFHAQIAREAGEFDFEAVAGAICDKLTRRHPHVFGNHVALSIAEQSAAWEDIKAAERTAAERKVAKRDATEHDAAERKVAMRDVTEHDTAERGVTKRDVTERDTAERGVAKRDVTERDTAERRAAKRDATERDAAEHGTADPSALQGVPNALPALMRAYKLSKRAARVGFDFENAGQCADKVAEELAEVRAAARDSPGASQEIFEEIGDLLFAAANLARKFDIDAEAALRSANAKFERRFRGMESLAAQRGQVFAELDLAAQELLWQAVKRSE